MPTVEIPFCGQSYSDRTVDANAQRCINLYPTLSPTPEDPRRIVLYPTPGYSLFQDTTDLGITGTGPIRGWFEINDVLYVVSGNRFIKTEYDPNVGFGGTATNTAIGTLNTSSGRCSLACNTVEIVISDGNFGYVYNLTSGNFSVISGGSFPATGGVTNFTFIDGYILAAVADSKQIVQSNLLAGGTYGAQAFAATTAFPDHLRAIFSDQLQLYIFGPKLTEVRVNSGATPFAFEKVQGVLIQAGCVAWPTIVKAAGSIIWLASDAAGKAYIAAMEGYAPKVLSTPPINEALERYTTIDDAFAYTYREGDSQFYCLTFPTEGVTWVYDLKMSMWHERTGPGGTGRDTPDHYILFQGRHLIGDSTGKMYWMSQDYPLHTDNQGPVRIRSGSHVSADGLSMFIHEFQLDTERGVGLFSDHALHQPLATLAISRDGGHTWTTVGTGTMGKIGQYKTRLIWRRLGRARERITFRVTISAPVRTYILGARARIEAGTK